MKTHITSKLFIVLLIIVLLNTTGCNNRPADTSTDPQEPTSSAEPQESTSSIVSPPSSFPLQIDVQLDELIDIVDFQSQDSLVVTRDGTLYKIGMFSDGTRIKKIDNRNYIRFIGDLIVDSNNNVYSFNNQTLSTQASTFNGHVNLHGVIPSGILCSTCALVNCNIFRVYTSMYIKNNSLYINTDNITYDGMPSTAINIPAPAYTFNQDENIEYMVDGTIKTNKGYYFPLVHEQQSSYNDAASSINFTMSIPDFNTDDLIFIKKLDAGLCIVDKNGRLQLFSA